MLLFSLLFPLAAVALLPVLWHWRFALFYRANARDVTSPLEQWPLAVVIVPLRGPTRGSIAASWARCTGLPTLLGLHRSR
jgi:hypothetical protein